MKEVRHARIKDIIEHQVIETQDDLAKALQERKIKVTQATVSRDIKDLMLIKVPTSDGRYRYAFPEKEKRVFSENRLRGLFSDAVNSIDYSENIVVVKTLPGTASPVASLIDNSKWPEVLGTVAGDDTIMVVVKPKEAVPAVIERMEEILGQ